MKKGILALVLLGSSLMANAQSIDELFETKTDTVVVVSNDKYKVETNYFWDNWFLSAGAGTQLFFADHNKQMRVWDRFTPAVDLSTGKWFTPGVGVRLGLGGYELHGASGWSEHSAVDAPNYNWYNYLGFIKDAEFKDFPHPENPHWVGDVYENTKDPKHYTMYQTQIYYLNTHVDVMFNLMNLFGGYKPTRKFALIPYLGVGWAHTFNKGIYENRFGNNVMGKRSNEVSANVGMIAELMLTKSFGLNLDVRGAYVNDRFDQQIGGRYGEGIASATIGFTYKFNQTGWDKSKTKYIRQTLKDVDALRNRLIELEKANALLKDAADRAQAEKEVKETVLAGPLLVTFIINRTDLSNEARVNLGFLAEAIKKNPNSTFVITGFADAGTGNDRINNRLSKGRSEAVYNCLVNEFGVNPKQIRAEYEGGVENMFYNDPRCSRAVIARVE